MKTIKTGAAHEALATLMRIEQESATVKLPDRVQFIVALNINVLRPTIVEYERQRNRIEAEVREEGGENVSQSLVFAEVGERDAKLREENQLFSGLKLLQLDDLKVGKARDQYVVGLSVLAPIIENWDEEVKKIVGDDDNEDGKPDGA